MKRVRFAFLSIVAAGLIPACAVFRSGQPQASGWPPAASAKKASISVALAGAATLNGTPHEVNSEMLDKWRRWTWSAYEDSGLFSDVRTGLSETDLRAEVSIREDADVNYFTAVLTGLTLYLIPSKASSTLTAVTHFSNPSGREIASIEKSESLDLWQGLFLLFVMPGHFPNSQVESIVSDLSKATLVEAESRGLLNAR